MVMGKTRTSGLVLVHSLRSREPKYQTNLDSAYSMSSNAVMWYPSILLSSFCSLDSLRVYKNEDIIIQLPGEMTIFKIDWLSVYDVDTKTNLGSVIIPDGLNVPPSLVKVIYRYSHFLTYVSISNLRLSFAKNSYRMESNFLQIIKPANSLPNCVQLHRKYQMSWEIFGPQITIQLIGQIGWLLWKLSREILE